MTTTLGKNGETIYITPEQLHQKADASAWFVSEVKVPTNAQNLLKQYSGIPGEQVVQHVTELRDRAFKAWPYPCIGQARFLELVTSKHPDYPLFLQRVKENCTFLDAGCCLGQDIRQLLLDGAPTSDTLYGTDLEGAFFGLGYELFKDQESLKSEFIAADLTKPLDSTLTHWRNRMDVISAQSLFHLFGLEGQKAVAHALVQLSRPQPGSLISGRQVGHETAQEQRGLTEESRAYVHNPASWANLWKEVGDATGSKWSVRTWVETPPERVKKQKWYTEGVNFLVWTAVRDE